MSYQNEHFHNLLFHTRTVVGVYIFQHGTSKISIRLLWNFVVLLDMCELGKKLRFEVTIIIIESFTIKDVVEWLNKDYGKGFDGFSHHLGKVGYTHTE